MTERKTLSKKARFEVFKRDNFTCQYCGQSAPDVVLECDHIDPVANGGGNDIINLVTSCHDCNSGKGARTLDDDTAIQKQRAQLEELNERREQLEMMLRWREGLADLDERQVDAFDDEFRAATNCGLSKYGRDQVKRWLKRHSISDLLDGLSGALDTYYKGGSDDVNENNRMAGRAFDKTVRVLNSQKKYADKPWMKDLFYVRGIIRNRHYCNERKAIDLLEDAYQSGISIDDLKDLARTSTSWTTWHRTLCDWIDLGAPE